MKQGLLLMAVYALIINQAKKTNHQDIPEVVLKKMEATVPVSSLNDQLRIDKYAYLNQSVFLVTSPDSRSFIMLEDGTCYEVIDHRNEAAGHTGKNNADYYTNAVYKNKDMAQR
jgi:hypothetical protein